MENEKTKIEKCVNRNCRKDHCAHHWKNHEYSAEGWNLNPYDEFKCRNYYPKFKTPITGRLKITK